MKDLHSISWTPDIFHVQLKITSRGENQNFRESPFLSTKESKIYIIYKNTEKMLS